MYVCIYYMYAGHIHGTVASGFPLISCVVKEVNFMGN